MLFYILFTDENDFNGVSGERLIKPFTDKAVKHAAVGELLPDRCYNMIFNLTKEVYNKFISAYT